jgi:putative membrane protein
MTPRLTWLPDDATSATPPWTRPLAALFIGAMAFSLAGSLMLRLFPASMALFGPLYPLLVKIPTWTYMALLPAIAVGLYGPGLGARHTALFALAGGGLGAASELIGTTTGVPFGAYRYTEWLGPKILGHVPYFIPLSWFAMSIVSFDLASRVTEHRIRKICLAAAFMVLWDVSLDPAMSRAFPFWTYPDGGIFYGMPLSNWAGWFAVSLAIMWAYTEIVGSQTPRHAWAPVFYVLNAAFPLAISTLSGLYGAVACGLVATAIPLVLVHRAGTATPLPKPAR